MADNKISFFYGDSSKIAEKVTDGTINGSDFVVGKDDDTLYFVTPDTQDVRSLGNAKSKVSHTVELGAGGSVGSLKTGDVIDAGISLDDLIKRLTVKQVPPTYTAPTASIAAAPATSAYEVGTRASVKFTGTFNQKDAGALTSLDIIKSDVAEPVFTSAASPAVTTYEFDVPESTVSFTAKATFAEGAIKKDNLGADYADGHIVAGSVSSSKFSVTGKRCVFYGAGAGVAPAFDSAAVRALSGKALGPAAGTKFTISVAVGQQYVAFAYPSNLRDVNQVKYVEANDPNMAANFTKSEVTVEGANSFTAAGYKVYVLQMATPAEAGMTFEVTI